MARYIRLGTGPKPPKIDQIRTHNQLHATLFPQIPCPNLRLIKNNVRPAYQPTPIPLAQPSLIHTHNHLTTVIRSHPLSQTGLISSQ